MTFGRCLRVLRESGKWGLRELARELGLSATYLSSIERDKVGPPADERLVAIADALGVDRARLFAAAGRVDPEILALLIERPELRALVRAAAGLRREDILGLACDASFAAAFDVPAPRFNEKPT